MPAKIPAEPSEIPCARARRGSDVTATFVTALRISGWAIAIRIWPASAAANVSELEPDRAADRGQPRARQQRGPEAAVQRQTGRDREQHVEQREDLREPADGALGDAEVLRRGGRDRRVGQPQQLVRRGDRGVGGDGSPARGHAAGRYKPGMSGRSAAVRAAIRAGEWDGPTASLAPGFTQANLVALPGRGRVRLPALLRRQPAPVPGARGHRPGRARAAHIAPGADLRTDLPRYRVHRDGEVVDELTDVRDVWRDDLVAFLIGCSFTFERALLAAGLPVRHIEQGVNVPMYTTAVACHAAGRFAGPLVVSMRPMTPQQAIRATEITSRYTAVHGAPVHIGDPEALGIADARQPAVRRPGRDPRRRGAGVLGLRRHAAGRRRRQPPGADDHPRPRAHVRHRRPRRTMSSRPRPGHVTHMLLKDKNAVIYGGGGSIGGAVARAFAREGARVFLAGRTQATLKAVADDIRRRWRASSTRSTPLRSSAHADAVGRIDISFNADHPQRRPGHADGRDGRRGLPGADRHRRAHELPHLEGRRRATARA